jgi:hypothetical protein
MKINGQTGAKRCGKSNGWGYNSTHDLKIGTNLAPDPIESRECGKTVFPPTFEIHQVTLARHPSGNYELWLA